jgi:5'-deoxynucleotidase YfbR-like HD superfamily hydrolase
MSLHHYSGEEVLILHKDSPGWANDGNKPEENVADHSMAVVCEDLPPDRASKDTFSSQ